MSKKASGIQFLKSTYVPLRTKWYMPDRTSFRNQK